LTKANPAIQRQQQGGDIHSLKGQTPEVDMEWAEFNMSIIKDQSQFSGHSSACREHDDRNCQRPRHDFVTARFVPRKSGITGVNLRRVGRGAAGGHKSFRFLTRFWFFSSFKAGT
jgi:hypothetical protein